MAITYTWKIDMLHTTVKPGVGDAVTEIHWSKTGIDENGISGRHPGVTKFIMPEIPTEGFIPLNQLSEDQVLNWIKSDLSAEDIIFIDSKIISEIQFQSRPANTKSFTTDNLPWTPQ